MYIVASHCCQQRQENDVKDTDKQTSCWKQRTSSDDLNTSYHSCNYLYWLTGTPMSSSAALEQSPTWLAATSCHHVNISHAACENLVATYLWASKCFILSTEFHCLHVAQSSNADMTTVRDGRHHRNDWQLSVNCFSRPDSNSCFVSTPPPIHTPSMNTCGTFRHTHTRMHRPHTWTYNGSLYRSQRPKS